MRGWKSYFAGALTAFLITGAVGTASATVGKITKELEYRDIKVSLDGEVLALKNAKGDPVEPFMFDGTNYLPVRALAESLGLNVAWDGANATVRLTTPEERHKVYITATGKKYHYDSQCNGGTYWEVPLFSALGMKLEPCDKCVLTADHPEG